MFEKVPSTGAIQSQPQPPAPGTTAPTWKDGRTPLRAPSGLYGVPIPVSEGGLVGEASIKPPVPQAKALVPGQVAVVGTGPIDTELARTVLPTGDALRKSIGKDPKEDITLGITLRKMSTHYKDVLAKLDAVHGSLNKATTVTTTSNAQATQHIAAELNAVMQRLTDLHQSLQGYADAHNTTHKADMQNLQQAVEQQMALLARLQGELAQGTPWPPELSVQQATVYLRADPSLTLEQLGLAARAGFSEADVKAYVDAHIPIHAATMPGGSQLQGAMQPLGSGGTGSVFKGTFKQPSGPTMQAVFKPEPEGVVVAAAEHIGIPSKAPAFSARSVATARLDQALKLGLTPPAEFHLHGGKLGMLTPLAPGKSPLTDGDLKIKLTPLQARAYRENPQDLQALQKDKGWLGVKLVGNTLHVTNTKREYRADGSVETGADERPMQTVVEINYKDPVLRKELTKLQWFDALCGQVDRHAHNYFVHIGDDGHPHVTAIDNDLAFGKNTVHPDDINVGDARGKRFVTGTALRGAKLPQVIDRETRNALMALRPEDLDRELGGLLAPEEIQATKQRLQEIQGHILSLDLSDRVFDRDDQWETPTADKLLGMPNHKQLEWQLDQLTKHANVKSGGLKDGVTQLAPARKASDQAEDASYVARDATDQFIAQRFKTKPTTPLETLQ